jgi:hypothetical protein
MAHTRCMLDKTICMHAHTHAHAPGQPHVRMHARTHAHTDKYLLLFHGNSDSRTRLSVTLYVHCLLLCILKGLSIVRSLFVYR